MTYNSSGSPGLPPTPSLDHVSFFTSLGNPAFTGLNLAIICSLRAIKLSFVTIFTVKFYICVLSLLISSRKAGSIAGLSHLDNAPSLVEGLTQVTSWRPGVNNCLSSSWMTNWKWMSWKLGTTKNRGCLTCLVCEETIGRRVRFKLFHIWIISTLNFCSTYTKYIFQEFISAEF